MAGIGIYVCVLGRTVSKEWKKLHHFGLESKIAVELATATINKSMMLRAENMR